jgi:hypothetical protein
VVTARARFFGDSSWRAEGEAVSFGGEGAEPFLFRLQDIALPAFLRENVEVVFGIGGNGTSEYGLP